MITSQSTTSQNADISFRCSSETMKPEIMLVHLPGMETRVAVQDPHFWGFDPSLAEAEIPFENWLENAQEEHRGMTDILRSKGIQTLFVEDLLSTRLEEVRRYLNAEFTKALDRSGRLSQRIKYAIKDSLEDILQDPVRGIMMGLEAGIKFSQLSYEERRRAYRTIKTLMPQTSLVFTQDPVISTPAGLVKARMAMPIRTQEPDIIELALGEQHYLHRMRNTKEGGDVTINSHDISADPRYAGGDVLHSNGNILVGVSSESGYGIVAELNRLMSKINQTSEGQLATLTRFYVPDYFDRTLHYETGNVMHLDTLLMPIGQKVLLGNKRMLEQTAVAERNCPLINAFEWAKNNYDRVVEVPDHEHTGNWGANVLPIGGRVILSSIHLRDINRNLREAGFEVTAIKSETLNSGFGSFHCMTAYLR